MPLEEDLLAEGEPDKEFDAGIASRLPRKRVGGGALFRDAADRFLMVEPVYKPTWEIPGGLAIEDESPRQACVRELDEELGLTAVPVGDLLVVDWVPRRGIWIDGMMFIFDGGRLTEEQVSAIRLPPEELRAFRFVTLAEATELVRPSMARRLAACLDAVKAGRTLYLEFGRPL